MVLISERRPPRTVATACLLAAGLLPACRPVGSIEPPAGEAPRTSAFVVYDEELSSHVLPFTQGPSGPEFGAEIILEELLVADRRAPGAFVAYGTGEPWFDEPAAAWARRCPQMHEPQFVGREEPEGCGAESGQPFASVTTTFAADGSEASELSCNCVHVPYADAAVFQQRGFDVDDTFEDIGDEGFSTEEWESSCPPTTDIQEMSVFRGELSTGGLYAPCPDSPGDSWSHRVEIGRTAPFELPKDARPARALLVILGDSDSAAPWREQAGLFDRAASSWPATPVLVEQVSGWLMEAYASEDDSPRQAVADTMEACIENGSTLWSIRRGFLVEGTAMADRNGVVACHRAFEIGPELCDDAFEPCGDAKAFPRLAAGAEEFWVSSDDRFALVWGERYHVVDAQGRSSGARPTQGVTVIGVEYHDDASALLRVAHQLGAQGDAAPEEGTAEVLPGRMWPVDMPEPQREEIARAHAVGVDDHGDGRAWGNRCFADYKAGRIDEAIAACREALELAKAPNVRAAVFYSLGRIAEARLDFGGAAAYYRTSQVLRPAPATERALSDLIERQISVVYPDAPAFEEDCYGADCE